MKEMSLFTCANRQRHFSIMNSYLLTYEKGIVCSLNINTSVHHAKTGQVHILQYNTAYMHGLFLSDFWLGQDYLKTSIIVEENKHV